MLSLLLALWFGAAPLVVTDSLSGPDETEGPARPPVVEDSPSEPPLPQAPTRRRSKGKRVMIGAGVAYGLGSAIQWATAGGTGMLADARPGTSPAVVLGLSLGGIGMVEGVLLGSIGAQKLAKASRGHDHRAKPLIAGGAVLAGLGGGAILGSALFMPSIRARCPIGIGCSLAGIHLGGAALSVGAGMISYGNTLRERDPNYRRLSKKAQSPIIAGSLLLGNGYVLSAALGMSVWQQNPDDDLARRTRNRMLVPVVGPWIHAAGPDAPLLVAMVTGALGALQIGGAIALAAGVGIARGERRRWRERERVQVTVVPGLDGVSIVGRF